MTEHMDNSEKLDCLLRQTAIIATKVSNIEKDLDEMVPRKEYEAYKLSIDKRLTTTQKTFGWTAITIVVALITAKFMGI